MRIGRRRAQRPVLRSLWAQNLVRSLSEDERWALKQALAEPGRYYGDGGTIHDSGVLDVEVTAEGRVVAVWFRCQLLPYQVNVVTPSRNHTASSMDRVRELPAIRGVELTR